MLTKELEEFGLSEKEAKIYLALVELEIATAHQVAERADVNRSSTYVVLDSLLHKGLVSVSNDKNVKQYVATNPEVLLREIDTEIEQKKIVREGINKILPELKALHRETKKRPKVRVFEGKKGLIASFEDSLTSKEKLIRVTSAVSKMTKLLPLYFPKYVKKRKELGITMKGIHLDDTTARTLQRLKIINPQNHILLDADKYNFPVDYAIYDDKIAYMTAEGGGLSIIVESPGIAEVSKEIFDLAFEKAKLIKEETNPSSKEVQQ